MTRSALTYLDYAVLPDDGRRYELHEGELSVTPSPGLRHQLVKANLFSILRQQVLARRLGLIVDAPFDCILSEVTVVQPDIVHVRAADAARVSERAVEGAPTLAVEVLSPSTEGIDRRRKLELYAGHGVPWYWIVDPVERTIDAHGLGAASYDLRERLTGGTPQRLPRFPDLDLDPGAIWA